MRTVWNVCAEKGRGLLRRELGAEKEKGRCFRIGLPLLSVGSPTWARTRDLRINSPALYRLSYRGTAEKEIITSFSSFRQQLFNVLFSSEAVSGTLVRLETGLQWAFPPVAALPCSTARPHYSQLFNLCKQKNRPEAVFLHWGRPISRTPGFRHPVPCAASAKSSCTACGSSCPGRCTVQRRRPPARLRGSPTGSASSCPGRC